MLRVLTATPRAPHAVGPRGIYRVIRSRDITVYIHVEDFVEDSSVHPGQLYSARHPEIPISTIFVSWGTAVLLDNERLMYTGEVNNGVCLCGSRAGLGSA